ncbi:MAG: M15 family metallopeptidase [Holosporaceae bacterium]
MLHQTTQKLPQGFVDVQKVIPDALVALKYATSYNFLGRPLNGYRCQRSLLTVQAAEALLKAAQTFKKAGFGLVLYDTYRPLKAVRDLVAWGGENVVFAKEKALKALYYPTFEKKELFLKGYISDQSAHARGSTVDLTLIDLKRAPLFDPCQGVVKTHTLSDGRALQVIDDGTLDMGGHFDLFDPSAHQGSALVSPAAQKNRAYLLDVMRSCGFQPIQTEWWHFTLENEPFKERSFDFDVA